MAVEMTTTVGPQGERFRGRVAIVTGGADGIGAATALRLGQEGAAVVVVDVAGDGAERITEELSALGAAAHAVPADVADVDSWDQVVQSAEQAFGGVDVLVNNACAWKVKSAHTLPVADWRSQIDTCLTSVYLGFQACHKALEAREGKVVNVSSVHALVGLPEHPGYAAAKGGVVALTRQLAVDYGPRIRVNAVLPGPILTQAWDRVSEEDRTREIEKTIAKRFGTAEEVAAVIAFLASEEASYITGSALVVDGGYTACR